MKVHGFVYGLRVRSNVQIPGLPAVAPTSAVDVDIHFGDGLVNRINPSDYRRRYASPMCDEGGQPLAVVDVHETDGSYLWVYSAGPRFLLASSGCEIWCDWPSAAVEDAAACLLGPILGFVLRLRHVTCLHASAIAIGDRAIALVGRPSSGKSTTAAALMGFGHALMSEDVVPLRDRGSYYEAVPGYPVVRLWPASVNMLFGPDVSLPLLTRSHDKRRLDLAEHGYRFQAHPLPLAAVYYLNKHRSTSHRAPVVESISSQHELLALVSETYTNYALSTDMRAREFEVLGRLTRMVPFRRATAHKDPARLPQLCRAILDDFEALSRENAETSSTTSQSRAPIDAGAGPDPS